MHHSIIEVVVSHRKKNINNDGQTPLDCCNLCRNQCEILSHERLALLVFFHQINTSLIIDTKYQQSEINSQIFVDEAKEQFKRI